MVNTLHDSEKPTREEKSAGLERILESQTLHGAEILKSFLRFVVCKSLEGLENEVKEYTIATEVFGRNQDYNPRIDSLVRVQAARLRSKLEEYYASEGKNDRVHIALPKGHYVPAFAYLNLNSSQADYPASRPIATSSAPRPSSLATKQDLFEFLQRTLPAGLAVASLVLLLLAYRYYTEADQLRQYAPTRQVDSAFVRDISPFWAEFLAKDSPLLVTFSNPAFQGNVVDGLKYLVPAESSAPALPPPSISPVVENPAIIDIYTGVGEVKSVYFLGNLLWKVGHPFRVERSRLLTWEDLKAHNIVCLGGPAENLQLRRLPQEQEFVFKFEGIEGGSPKFVILNRKPQHGEQTRYAPVVEGSSQSTVTEDYALVSMLKGLDPNRRLLILAGVTTFGTQACTEYVTRSETLKQLIQQLNVSRDSAKPKLPPYYQVLLKVKINSSVPVQTSYVTHHVLE
jgi:hypothetical protein